MYQGSPQKYRSYTVRRLVFLEKIHATNDDKYIQSQRNARILHVPTKTSPEAMFGSRFYALCFTLTDEHVFVLVYPGDH